MTDREDYQKRLMEAWLKSQELEHMKSYLERGRLYRDLDAADLEERWVAAFKEVAGTNREQVPLRNDLEAEMTVRGIQVNYDLVRPEIDSISKAAADAIERLKEDPDRFQRVNDELQADVDKFEEDAKRGH